ncbi:haloacid dehalogenase, partial [Aureobasidium pullulans]
ITTVVWLCQAEATKHLSLCQLRQELVFLLLRTKLTSFKLLSFDVYGTLIDWETGVINALQPLLDTNNKTSSYTRKHLLQIYHKHEASQQTRTPEMTYCDLLSTIHPAIAADLECDKPSEETNKAFGDSVGQWPAFPDTVAALHILKKHYKLVVLSNVDRTSFSKTNAGPLQNFPFDAILTAQDIGSYKPNLKNFEYMLQEVKERFGVEKEQTNRQIWASSSPTAVAQAYILRTSSPTANPIIICSSQVTWIWQWQYLDQETTAGFISSAR